jgi:thiaminase
MKKNKARYKVTHIDPCRWVYDSIAEYRDTKKEAMKLYQQWKSEYPGHQAQIKLEKVELICEEYAIKETHEDNR